MSQQQQVQAAGGGRRGSRSNASGLLASSLSAINEGDEHMTLMDVLGARNGPLSEEELWAVCREGCLAVRALGDASEAFQTLCLSPDTMAFDGHGSIRLLNFESENECDLTCQPPEFYQYGNSYKGHVYSLGSTMLMAAHYNVPDGGKTKHSRRLSDLLADMTEGDYESRADLERVLTECGAHLRGRSSRDICRAIAAKKGEEGPNAVRCPEDRSSSSADASLASDPSARRSSPVGAAVGAVASRGVGGKRSAEDPGDQTGSAVGCRSDSGSAHSALLSRTNRETGINNAPDGGCPASTAASQVPRVADSSTIPTAGNRTAAEPAAAGQSGVSAFCYSTNRSNAADVPELSSDTSTSATSQASDTIGRRRGDEMRERSLPAAYSSSATHFTPIILTQEEAETKPQPLQAGSDQNKMTAKKIKELKKRLVRNRHLAETAGSNTDGTQKSPLKTDQGVPGVGAVVSDYPPEAPLKSGAVDTSSRLGVPTQPPTSSLATADATLSNLTTPKSVASSTGNKSLGTEQICWQPRVPPQQAPLPAAGVIPCPVASSAGAVGATPEQQTQGTHATPPPFSSGVPFIVQQDPLSGVLQLVPLYASVNGAVFLPPSIPLSTVASTAQLSAVQLQPGQAEGPRATGREHGVIESESPVAHRASVAGLAQASDGAIAERKAGAPATNRSAELSPPPPPSPSYSKDSGVGSVSHCSGDPHLMERLLASGSLHHNKLLGKLIKLIRDEFAFDGYLDNGVEDLAMAEYAASLGGLRWDTFSSAITEKYCDLYWEEDLLSRLYETINGKPPQPSPIVADRNATKRLNAKSDHLKAKAADVQTHVTPSPFRPISAGFEQEPSAGQSGGHRPLVVMEQSSGILRPAARRSPPRKRSSSLSRAPAEDGSPGTRRVAMASKGTPTHRTAQAAFIKGRSSSVQDLLSHREERAIGRSFSQSALDRPNVPLRKTESRVSLDLLGTGLLVSGLSGSMPVIRVHGHGVVADDFHAAAPGRRSGTDAGRASDGSGRSTQWSSRRSSPLRDLGSLSRCSDSSSTKLSQLLGSESSDAAPSGQESSSHAFSDSVPTRQIDIVYYTSTLNRRLEERFKQAIDKADAATRAELLKRLQETGQQLAVHRKHRAKTLKYCRRLPDSVQQGKVAYDQKAVLDKALKDLGEANDELDFLLNVKRHLEMLLAEHNGLTDNLVYSLAKCCPGDRLLLSAAPENPLLQFKSRVDGLSRRGAKLLHAGTPLGLMANLFARCSLSQQYIHYFLYCYRYFTTSAQLLTFIAGKYESATLELEQKESKTKVENRALDLLEAWLEGYYSVDFKHDAAVQDAFTVFLQECVANYHPSRAESLFQLVEDLAATRKTDLTHVSAALRDDIDITLRTSDREWHAAAKSTAGGTTFSSAFEEREVMRSPPMSAPRTGIRKKMSFKANSGAKKTTTLYRRGRSGIISCVQTADDPYRDKEPYHLASSRKTDTFSLFDYSSQTVAEQLTLIEQAFFERCHPVHFMNSRAQGIAASLASLSHSATPRACVWDENLAGSCGSLFVGSYSHDAAIQCMIEHSQSVSYWVAAELVSCSSVKSQLTLLTKFIYVAKICKEIRNYATCMAVVDGLENLIVRQLPAWKDIPSKSIEELKSVKVFLTSDAMCLTDDEASTAPTLPSVLLFVLHIQQLEQGGFTLANGMYKWSKMKDIAKAVDQIRLFKQRCYEFPPRTDLCDDLIARMKDLCQYDLQTLAASRDVNFQKTSTGKWANAIRKLKGAFTS